MCYFYRLFVIQLENVNSNCNFDFYVTLHFTDYILWIKHKTLIKYLKSKKNTFRRNYMRKYGIDKLDMKYLGLVQLREYQKDMEYRLHHSLSKFDCLVCILEFGRVVVVFYCCDFIKFYTMGSRRFEIAIIKSRIFHRLIKNADLSER